jgi:glycosyltransferase involved in cell wall biosynthesis
MKINLAAYNYAFHDGYGRYARYLVRWLTYLGAQVRPVLLQELNMLPGWMQRLAGLDFGYLTIACTPPYMFPVIPGRMWGVTMTEGTRLPSKPHNWAALCNDRCERIIVPCEHNAEAFEKSGVKVPIHVIHGGTSPAEFPLLASAPSNPYTFLALADRGARKGWVEVWQAFFAAFQGVDNVRLVIKTRGHTNDLIDMIAGATSKDPRVSFWISNAETMADVYAQIDCFAIPSKSEGWGMPHREAAMMGVPTIVTRYSGLDDGHTDDWATIVLDDWELTSIPNSYAEHVQGKWATVNVNSLAKAMRWCYDHPRAAKAKAIQGSQWLRQNQTWVHSTQALLGLIERYN